MSIETHVCSFFHSFCTKSARPDCPPTNRTGVRRLIARPSSLSKQEACSIVGFRPSFQGLALGSRMTTSGIRDMRYISPHWMCNTACRPLDGVTTGRWTSEMGTQRISGSTSGLSNGYNCDATATARLSCNSHSTHGSRGVAWSLSRCSYNHCINGLQGPVV